MKLLFSLLFIFWVSFVSGQQIQLSEDLSKQGVEDYKILGKYEDQILVFTSEKGRHTVMAFDKEMVLLWSKKLEFELKRVSIVEVIPQKDAFNVVYKFSKAGETNLKILKFDPFCEQIDSNLIKKFDRWSYSVNPKIILSEDKESVLFYESEQFQSLEAYAFNLNKMELIWDQVFRPKYFNYHENFLDVVFNNQADAYLIMGTKNKKIGKEKNHFRIFSFKHEDRSTKEYKIHLDKYFWFDVEFYFDNLNQQLSAAGLCSDTRYYEVNGSFHLRIPSDSPEDKQLSFQEFDDEFMTRIMGKRFKRNSGFDEVRVQELILRKDGGILLVAERYRKQSRSGGSFQSTEYQNSGGSIDYQLGDIILVSIHPTGKIHWKNLLYKRQSSQDDQAQFSSYFLLKTQNSLRFFYNDEIEQNGAINEYSVNGKGSARRLPVKFEDTKDIQLVFKEGKQIAINQFIVPSRNRSGIRFALLKF